MSIGVSMGMLTPFYFENLLKFDGLIAHEFI